MSAAPYSPSSPENTMGKHNVAPPPTYNEVRDESSLPTYTECLNSMKKMYAKKIEVCDVSRACDFSRSDLLDRPNSALPTWRKSSWTVLHIEGGSIHTKISMT